MLKAMLSKAFLCKRLQRVTVTHTCVVIWCLQTLFVQRLHEVEAAGDAPGSSAPTGLPQKELLSWYFDKMVERCLLPARFHVKHVFLHDVN